MALKIYMQIFWDLEDPEDFTGQMLHSCEFRIYQA